MSTNIREFIERETEKLNVSYDSPRYYKSRELSWIEFNKRVLYQSIRNEVPLLEKFKFLGITDSNLDEFIMVRLSSVVNKMKTFYSDDDVEISGLTPTEEYNSILHEILEFKKLQDDVYKNLERKLNKNNINIVKYKELDDKDKNEALSIFMNKIYPLLTPVAYDTTKDLPLIRSKQLNIIVSLEDSYNKNLNVLSLIPLDNHLDRMYRLSSSTEKNDKYITLEELVQSFLDKIFINKNIIYSGVFKLLREGDIEIEHNLDIFIIERMQKTLIEREFSNPIFMIVEDDIPKNILKIFIKIFNLNNHHIYKTKGCVDYSFLVSKPIKNDILEYDKFNPQFPQELIGESDMFSAIDSNDIVLHHPYESFIPVIKFLENAADDKDVVAIKQTLYRVSSIDSPIIEALCRAAKNGKHVSVLLEIKARFDEEQNISLIEKLKLSGCNLIYGTENLKTHCKFILIAKKVGDSIKLYSHMGTGNYNDKTARIYTDISYFTSKRKIGEDLLNIFNILTGFSEPSEEGHKILFSPYNLRSHMYEMIDREIANHNKGKNSAIILKLNSLSDKGIIRKLYLASEAGVKVYILCRGICSIKKINKNIIVRSLIGRYLEHSRIYYFNNNDNPEVFISSADMLTRNLDKRVELLIPINNAQCKDKLIDILDKYFSDNFNSYKLDKDEEFKFITCDSKKKMFNVHQYFMDKAVENFKLRNIPKISL